MSLTFTVACVQNCALPEMEPNLREAADLARQAAKQGAEFICLPEYFSSMEMIDSLLLARPLPESEHPALPLFTELSRELRVVLLLGSLAIELPSGETVNRCFLIDAQGEVTARYDKIHLFDVDLPGGESYRESRSIKAGSRAVVAATPWGPLGLSICYDLRFPHLYRALAQAGAAMLAVPAAFTKTTGEAHWHILLRSRAIETGCFVFAPSQYGVHAGERACYGHSLIVDPWGRVLADGGEEAGFVTATIDLAEVQRARRMIPSLQHDRPFDLAENEPPLRTAGGTA